MLQTLQKTELTWIKKNYGKNKKREVILIIRNPHPRLPQNFEQVWRGFNSKNYNFDGNFQSKSNLVCYCSDYFTN